MLAAVDNSLSVVARGYAVATARPVDSLSRLQFWIDTLGDRPITDISADDVDMALAALAKRGRMRPVRNGQPVATGQPLAPSSITRYAGELAGIYKFARKQRLIPRSFIPPTRGLESPQSPLKTDFISPEQKDRLVAVARSIDRRWGRMPALIEVAFSSGWRAGNLKALRWADVDLDTGFISAPTSKTGRALTTPISSAAVAELRKLPGRAAGDTLVFSNRSGRAFHWRALWLRTTTLAHMKGYNFHLLRHGCASTLAAAGAGQAQLMAHMGHSTLAASRRYLHADLAAQASLSRRVFG